VKGNAKKNTKGLLRFTTILGFLFTCFLCQFTYAKAVLKVATSGLNSDNREAIYSVSHQFEQLNPGVKIQFIFQSDTKLKGGLSKLLKQQNAVDIVIWHSGERLNDFIEQDLVLDITELWNDKQLNNQFTSINKDIVMMNGQSWAIPISYYQWGIYYKKSLFKRLAISPPENWQQFVDMLTIIKQNNIAPIYIGSKNLWPIGAWFEYLNLRLNGLEYHNAFVRGEVSANSERIKEVLEYWKNLIDRDYFFEKHQGKDLADGFPFIYRELAAIILSGHMVKPYMDEQIIDDIGFFPFPKIKNNIANIQVTPVDVMFIAKSSVQQEWAKKLILFAANKDVQTAFNAKIKQFPVNKHSIISNSNLLKEMQTSLNQAEGRTYFYDREVKKQYGQDNLEIWKAFLIKPDIKKTMIKMEQARINYLARNKESKISKE